MVAMVKKGNVCAPVSVVRRQYGRIAKAEQERRPGVLLQRRLLLTAVHWLQRSKWKAGPQKHKIVKEYRKAKRSGYV